MNTEIHFIDTRNNKTYIRKEDNFEPVENILFLYFEGNYGCDCNRSQFCGIDKLKCNTDENIIEITKIIHKGETLDIKEWE